MPGPRPTRPDEPVFAVVTSFHPDQGLVEVCRSVRDQVDRVIVVDDGSGAEADEVLDACARLGVEVVRQPSNQGISAALNAGAAHAGPGTLLTLDQDSRLPAGYVAGLLDIAERARQSGVRVGIVGPSQAGGVREAGGAVQDGVVIGREPIQSGLLVTAQARADLGDFDAGLFIDGVDTEYWLRARERGWVTVVAPDLRIEHSLGRVHRVRLLGRSVPVRHAATFRYYFIARNRIALLRRYGRRERGWATEAVLRDLRHLLIVTVLVPGRAARLAASVQGWRDGGRGRTGPRPTRQPRSESR